MSGVGRAVGGLVRGVTGLFQQPSMPAIPDPIKPPTVDDARQAEEDLLKLRRRRGRASTFLFGRTPASASSALLGAAPPTSTASAGSAAMSGAQRKAQQMAGDV